MVINGLGGANAQAGAVGMNQSNDPVVKNIERQIADIQKQLQELSSNKDMSVEDKMKKRQELQQQINELNNQLRQHQMEQRKEKQQKKESSDDIFDPNSQKYGNQAKGDSVGISQAGMEAMISADTSMKQAAAQGSVASKMEGKAGVLEVEIKLDSARNGNVERKQAELADVKNKAQNASAAALETLADANEAMKNASGAENAGNAKKSEDDGKNSASGKDNASKGEEDEAQDNQALGNKDETSKQTIYYTPVDVRL